MSLIWYAAWAAANGFNFGGVVPYNRVCPESHGVDTLAPIGSLLGEDPDSIFLRAAPPMDFEFGSWADFAADAPRLRNCSRANVGLWSKNWSETRDDPLTYWTKPPPATSAFISALRHGAHFLERPTLYRRSVLNVALHVRRDDVSRWNRRIQWRYVPDQWYFKLVQKMKDTLAVPMDVHVFSSTGHVNMKFRFRAYSSKGMSVHLNRDVLDDWSDMARADILVMAPSKFSLVPGLFNQKCVLDLKQWIGNSSWTQFLHFVPVTPTMEYLNSPDFGLALAACKSFADIGSSSQG